MLLTRTNDDILEDRPLQRLGTRSRKEFTRTYLYRVHEVRLHDVVSVSSIGVSAAKDINTFVGLYLQKQNCRVTENGRVRVRSDVALKILKLTGNGSACLSLRSSALCVERPVAVSAT